MLNKGRRVGRCKVKGFLEEGVKEKEFLVDGLFIKGFGGKCIIGVLLSCFLWGLWLKKFFFLFSLVNF